MADRRNVAQIERVDNLGDVLSERSDVHVFGRAVGGFMPALVVEDESVFALEFVDEIFNGKVRRVQPVTEEKRFALTVIFVIQFGSVFYR